MKNRKIFSAVCVAAVLSGCSATTSIRSVEPGTMLKVNHNTSIAIEQDTSVSYRTTSFGQYKFKATKEGSEPMYGLMPLKFNGGYLAADILFFAPAMFFNLREVNSFYEFDVEEGVVRYKQSEDQEWIIYKPTDAESERAKKYFKEG